MRARAAALLRQLRARHEHAQALVHASTEPWLSQPAHLPNAWSSWYSHGSQAASGGGLWAALVPSSVARATVQTTASGGHAASASARASALWNEASRWVVTGPGAWQPAGHLATSTIRVSPSSMSNVGGELLRRLMPRRIPCNSANMVLGVVGDTPLMVSQSGAAHESAERVRTVLRRVSTMAGRQRGKNAGGQLVIRNGPRLLNAAGMGLTAAITREDREGSPMPSILLRLIASSEGPQKIGVGLLPSDVRDVTASLLCNGAVVACAYAAWVMPTILPWMILCAMLAYATRPDLESFRTFMKERAPELARGKAEIVDRIRVYAAPYLMGLCNPPHVSDYGLFTVITVRDYADYVYVYFGFLSRWLLLGWYNAEDDFNFDVM